MAQGNKSRIVIWVIVGILVVVAAVMLITKPKTTSGPPINPERFVRITESKFEKLERRVAEARLDFPDAPAEQWQRISDEVAHGRQALAELSTLTEQKDLAVKKAEATGAYAAATKVLREVTGKEEHDED
ncbi:hypothetical protein FJY70_00085 [candidate division WOR-3 bacterium]|nr:hypothetical protein [candidate division WOR-3 bacterium]